MQRFVDQVAIVTGAAQGIGAATARRLAREGARVAVVDTTIERCEDTVVAIREAGGAATAYGCDVADESAVEATVGAVMQDHGRLDVLVNNAGISPGEDVVDLSLELWNKVIAVNLTGAFLCSRAFLRLVRDQRRGKIVNVGSQSALGHAGRANYAASKAGIHALTATLAMEAGEHNINVNAVAPGYVATAMTAATAARAGLSHEEHQAREAQHTALGRVATADDIAAVICFLASEDASYVSGQAIFVTGGPAK